MMDYPSNYPETADVIRIVESQRNHELSLVIASMYVASAPVLVQAMGEAAADGDLRELFRAADALRASSANLGAKRVAQLCHELSDLPSKQALPGVADKLDKIAIAVAIICSALIEKTALLAPREIA
jgi:two-component system, sensor histidine kinase and response regulator